MLAKDYISHDWKELLTVHGLTDFGSLWDLPLDALDEPNVGRGGWSRVFLMSLDAPDGTVRRAIVKRQRNHLSRSVLHPIHGITTFQKELCNIQRCRKLDIPAVEAVYYGQRRDERGHRAMLVTEYLEGYTQLSELAEKWELQGWPQTRQRKAVVEASASLVRKLHRLRLRHGHLQPKHIMVKTDNGTVDARLIDLECMCSIPIGSRSRLKDLYTLNRRSTSWQNSDKLRFLLTYLDIPRLDMRPQDDCAHKFRTTERGHPEVEMSNDRSCSRP